ncbi:MAG: DUF883 C-terminal domain-containing protein [Methylobacter sp.]|nr:DUF883 C-terminal domain-containing protein [Methylobacter sp.]MDP2099707.1 DUF883 C-terminal domain-containing protein [Methylobacter sp.]MDP2430340.1 DUF883 C-terminal domain-containing protein [Methylobacter sp.]MDP3053509.1 DUF883 C-terminal domain-containing protein [Methylobacter sp.]MDP3362688.1 DUF883 C-terminal domain-containing protein [Methylobacter sp.]
METIEKAAHSAHQTVDMIADVTTQAVEALGEKGQQLKNGEQQLLEDCRNYVHDNPITSLGIAAAAGFLLSRLLSAR